MTTSAPPRWIGRAFGLAVSSELQLPGFERAPVAAAPQGGRRVAVRIARAGPRASGGWGERVHESRLANGEVALAIDRCPRSGYRFELPGDGVFELSPEGSRITCRPGAAGASWRRRRYLIGQVLPFAALLQGLEVFHASAVEISGSAVCLAGPSGAGKSTLALNMSIAGARFLTDDVLALTGGPSGILAHPGFAAAKVRRSARSLLAADAARRLGAPWDGDESEDVYEIGRSPGPLPLGAICLLEPAAEPTEVEVKPVAADPWSLLGATFNLLVQDRPRLDRQLEVCQRIADTAVMVRARVPARPGPGAADQLAASLAGLLPERPRERALG